MQVRG
ncbi:unnamed protein product [Linum tenue]|jgi:hypothetical protein